MSDEAASWIYPEPVSERHSVLPRLVAIAPDLIGPSCWKNWLNSTAPTDPGRHMAAANKKVRNIYCCHNIQKERSCTSVDSELQHFKKQSWSTSCKVWTAALVDIYIPWSFSHLSTWTFSHFTKGSFPYFDCFVSHRHTVWPLVTFFLTFLHESYTILGVQKHGKFHTVLTLHDNVCQC